MEDKLMDFYEDVRSLCRQYGYEIVPHDDNYLDVIDGDGEFIGRFEYIG